MGICYTINMYDDFDWDYVGKSKWSIVEEFSKEFEQVRGFKPELLAQWRHHLVFDIDKTPPYIDEYKVIIKKYCDSCTYESDNEDGQQHILK
jgi:hypothetical protein